MATIQVYDPALCCPTGVCGPAVDPTLARFAGDLEWLKGQGVTVERYNLAQEPGAFAASEVVRGALEQRGNDVLPLVLCDGRIVAEGTYPAKETLAALSGIVVRGEAAPAAKVCAPSASGKKCC